MGRAAVLKRPVATYPPPDHFRAGWTIVRPRGQRLAWEKAAMGAAVKETWLREGQTATQDDARVVAALAPLPAPQAEELKRLCRLYDKALDEGAIDKARQRRASLSDLIDTCCGGSAEQRDRLRAALGFTTGVTPIVHDQ